MKKPKKPKSHWTKLHDLAGLPSGDKLAKAMIGLVRRSLKKKPTIAFVPSWSVDGTVSLMVNGIDVTSLSGPLSYRELEACAKILRTISDEWPYFFAEICVALRPWMAEEARLLDNYAKIAKEVEESFKKAGEHLKKAQDKLPK